VATGTFIPDYDQAAIPYAPPGRSLRSFDELAAIDVAKDMFYGEDGRPNELWHRFADAFSLLSYRQTNINSARPDVWNYRLNATYTLTDIATGKPVVTASTFSRVSYNIPGQEQRFAGARGLRDAEDRAAKVIAENIRSRLASYFVAGS